MATTARDGGRTGSTRKPGARERMIASAAVLIRERGARATSIDDVLAHSGAPRGSVYHHFPGGRDQLLREAIELAGEFVVGRLQAADGEGGSPDRFATFDALLGLYREELIASDFRVGCPVVAVAIEAREGGDELTETAGSIFGRWTSELTAGFAAAGIRPERAGELADLAIAAAEGAIVVSRARREIEPFDRVRAEIRALLERERTIAEKTDPTKRKAQR